MHVAEQILSFIEKLTLPVSLPGEIMVMIPYAEPGTMQACTSFYKKFYSDQYQRRMIIGINPGRFGGGVTGIPFTDPIRLKNNCGIPNNWPQKQELSSLYIYEMIATFGGVNSFYNQFYITAVSPLGFIRDGKNLNYYDDKLLQKRIKPFVIDCFKKQFAFEIDRTIAFCLGDGKNFAYLKQLNAEEHLFERIVPLPHPRFIMQYRLKQKQEYIHRYLEQLRAG